MCLKNRYFEEQIHWVPLSMYLCRQACTLSSVIFYHELDVLYDLKILPSRPTVFKLTLCFKQDLLITLNPSSECDDLGFYTELNLYIFGFWTHRDVSLPSVYFCCLHSL